MGKIKIVIVTQTDPFYIPLFFKEFFSRMEGGQGSVELAGVVIQEALGNKTLSGLVKRVIGLYGLWGTIIKTLELLTSKCEDAFAKGVGLGNPRSIGGLAEKHGYPVLDYKDVNTPAFIEYLQAEKIDLVVSVSASQIFKQPVLTTPPLGCINLHNGELPKYKGMLPNFWQMYNGEKSTTLTIHKMAAKLDEGEIVLAKKTPIPPGCTLEQLIKRTKENSASELLKLLVDVANGKSLQGTFPSQANGSYYTFPSWDDVKEFKRRGCRVI